jgi:hypothetical protein
VTSIESGRGEESNRVGENRKAIEKIGGREKMN